MFSGGLLRCLALLILSNRALSGTFLDEEPGTSAPIPYIILTEQDGTEEQIRVLRNILLEESVPGSLEGLTSERTGLVVFFKATITSVKAETIASLPGVQDVAPDKSLEEKEPPSSAPPPLLKPRQESIPIPPPPERPPKPIVVEEEDQAEAVRPSESIVQSDAVDELKVVSQPLGVRLQDLKGYAYAVEAGTGVTIYVMDSGANPRNSEWARMTGTKRFLYVGDVERVRNDPMDHGSCVASKVTGPAYGTAKNANLVMVKMPDIVTLSDILTALVKISDDVHRKRLAGKAVVNISMNHVIADNDPTSVARHYKLFLVRLMADDIVIVTASGNDVASGSQDVSTYPALFGETTDLIVVGAVTRSGTRPKYAQGSGAQLTTSAPGWVTCASGQYNNATRKKGNSFAAPIVAGVIAVWLSQPEYSRLQVPGQVAANVKAMVKTQSYQRAAGGPDVIWNGIDQRRRVCIVGVSLASSFRPFSC